MYEQKRTAERYCGVHLDLRLFQQYDELKEYILAGLATNNPVMLGVDMYNLPWSEFCGKVHAEHCIVIHGHRKDDSFNVDDMTRQVRNLEFNLRDGASSPSFACICKVADSSLPGDEEVIHNNIRRLKEEVEAQKGYEQLLSMAAEWSGNEEASFAYSPELAEFENFSYTLIAAGRGRIAFAELLAHISVKSGSHQLDDIIYDLKAKGARWVTLRNRLIKYRMKGSWAQKSKEFMDHFTELINQDKAIYERFISLRDRKKDRSFSKPPADLPTETMFIDLKPYYNANAFNSHLLGNKEGFDKNGYYYGYEDENRLIDIETEGIKVSLPGNGRLDHISCQSQYLPAECRNLQAVLVIGSSEHGDFAADLLFQYENHAEKVELILSDWWDKGRYGEKVVKSLDCLKYTADYQAYEKVGTVNLFSQTIRVKEGDNKMLQGIKLPDVPNIRIFGLVLFYRL